MNGDWYAWLLILAMLLFVALILFIGATVTATAALAADLELVAGLGEAFAGVAADVRASADALLGHSRNRVRAA